MPKNLPNLLRRPVRESGIPVAREMLRFAAVTPSALFHENVSPGPSFIAVTVPVTLVWKGSIVVVGGKPRYADVRSGVRVLPAQVFGGSRWSGSFKPFAGAPKPLDPTVERLNESRKSWLQKLLRNPPLNPRTKIS